MGNLNNQDSLNLFHPVVKEWFLNNVGTPSLPQIEGWPQIQSGENVLISAPTGAGKTLAAFLESINRLLEMGIRNELPEGVFILYVSPLKALNNDINKNLELPFWGIRRLFEERGEPFPDIRKAVRTGDTTQYERTQILKKPPHILITTPESLFLMLTSVKAREILKNVHYMIIDEIHTLLGTKRGVHLALSMERLEALAQRKIIRIGLSATVNPLDTAARFLGGLYQTDNGYEERAVEIIAPAMERKKDLKIHVPVEDYRVLDQGSVWPDIYTALEKLIQEHQSTLVFVNNRATAEKVAANVNSIADEELCCPHHGSMSRRRRFDIEERFKSSALRCIIATSTLELGIDVGSVDFIVQVAAPMSVSSGLQRLGRAGHRLSAISSGVIIPKTRGDLVKSLFMAGEMLDGHIEKERVPHNCLDILAQHIVSMCCSEKWHEDHLFHLVKQAFSYRTLAEGEFKKVLSMLTGDYEHQEDIPAKPRILWDRQNHTLEGTTYSKMLAVSSSGTIPDRGTFPVYLEDNKTRIGELDEEFVFESRIGSRFMLGNSPWRISRIDKNRVVVAPCSVTGAAAPFWKGDGIGMPFEQAIAFGRSLKSWMEQIEHDTFMETAIRSSLLDETGALNVRNYLLDQVEATGTLSTDRKIVVEYTSANENDNKVVIHAHFGGRVNSVLSILFQEALDKKVRCKAYTSHTNDAVLIHLYGYYDTLSDIFSLISPRNVEQILINTLPRTSRFALTFRYNAYRALMMGIQKHGQRLPLWVQRLRSVDALENAQKYLDHPLIIETMRECLEDIFDIPNTVRVLQDIEQGRIQVVEKQTWFPSPFSSEILFQFEQEFLYMEKAPHPGQYEYPAISGPESLNLSYNEERPKVHLSDEAIQQIIEKNNAQYKLLQINSVNELHSFLLIYGDTLKEALTGLFPEWIHELEQQNRIVLIPVGKPRYIAAEEIELYRAAEGTVFYAEGTVFSSSSLPLMGQGNEIWTQDEAITRILRRFARYYSPFDKTDLLERYPFTDGKLEKILAKLIQDGYVIYSDEQQKYFHATIFDRASRLTMNLAVEQIKTRDASSFAALLCFWQNIGAPSSTPEEQLYEVITQLEGLYLPAEAWEKIVFPARIKGYNPKLLDKLCSTGRITWRIHTKESKKEFSLAWFRAESITYALDSNSNNTLELRVIPGSPSELNNAPNNTSEPGFVSGSPFVHNNGPNNTSEHGVISGSPLVLDNNQKSSPELKMNPCSSFQPSRKPNNALTRNDDGNRTTLSNEEGRIYTLLQRKGATFTHVLTSLSGFTASDLLDILKALVIKGLVVNDSYQALRYFMNQQTFDTMDPVQKARKIALMVSRMEMGRWELANPPKSLSIQEFIQVCGLRYGMVTKEINSIEESPYTWPEVYEQLKKMEYAGDMQRGYFFTGISGIQFMLPSSVKKIEAKKQDYIVLNACDPAQPYGRFIPQAEHDLPFTCVPGTAVVLFHGRPVLLLERHGDKITFEPSFHDLNASVIALKNAFQDKRIWPDRKKITVRYWPEDPMQKSTLQAALAQAGFMPEIDRMVLWR